MCGGPSATDHDLSLLAGRRVIVVNSSYIAVPRADYLVFTDKRWWEQHHDDVRANFSGEVVTVNPSMFPSEHYRLMGRARGSGLATDSRYLAVFHTTVTAATNLAKHLGASVVNYLGLDGEDRDGMSWHHEPHPLNWHRNPKRYYYHGIAMEYVAGALREAGVEAFNANSRAAHKMFPHRSFEEMLK